MSSVTSAVGINAPKLTYATNTVVTLTAPLSEGIEIFRYWTGCTSSIANTCTVTMNNNQTATAVYQPAVTLSVSPSTLTTVAGAAPQQFYFTIAPSTPAQTVTNNAVTLTLSSPAGSN